MMMMMICDGRPDELDADADDSEARSKAIAEGCAASEDDLPSVAIRDSGCTRTMHGSNWAEQFEAELQKFRLSFKSRVKNQLFSGVGG